jgi:hypothetical protein
MYCRNCGFYLGDTPTICRRCGWNPTSPAPIVGQPRMQPITDDAGMRFLLPVGRSVWAIAAGYAGLFAVLVLPAPVALVLGIVAVRDIRSHPDRHGMGRAVFGIVMGSLGTLLLAVFVVSLIAAGSHRR